MLDRNVIATVKTMRPMAALCFLLFFSLPAWAAPSPQEVLRLVDDVRAPGPDFVFTVKAELTGQTGATDNIFEVMVRDSVKSLVLYREPVKQRGRVLLMDGPDMWIFIPGTSRALRISPQQQLVGGVSHADVARVVFDLDYTAQSLNQVEEKGKTLLKLALTSKAANTPYRSLILYCTEAYEPVKAEFYSLSGKLLRTAYYESYQTVLGKKRPMAIRMVSAVDSGENVRLVYSDMGIKETPRSYYQPSYLNQIR